MKGNKLAATVKQPVGRPVMYYTPAKRVLISIPSGEYEASALADIKKALKKYLKK